MEIWLFNTLDQFRFISGMLIAELLFVVYSVEKKNNFRARIVLGFLLCLIISMGYNILPISKLNMRYTVAIVVVWYLLLTFISVGYIIFCFHISICNALFRCVLGITLQQVVTIVFRYWFITLIYPDMQTNYPMLYMISMILTYAAIYTAFYYLFIKKLRRSGGMNVVDSKRTLITNIIMIIALSLVCDMIVYISEYVLPMLKVSQELGTWAMVLRYFCIIMELFTCFILFVIQLLMNESFKHQRENALIKQLASERAKQYEISKESIAIIKQKSHDLKQQLLAFEQASYEEIKQMIAESKKIILTYDGIITTENETLNTILTEKSMQCLQHNIKFSCMVHTTKLEFMNIIDMYTLIGNALDNSIECVSRFQDETKKTISFSIQEVGKCICICTENYYIGEIQLQDGLPITTKPNKEYHGLGMKSIKLLTAKYKGNIKISTQDGIFTLQVLIPIP